MTGLSSFIAVLAAESLSWKEILACRTFWGLVVGAVGLWLALPRRAPYGKALGGTLALIALPLLASDWPLLPTPTDQVVFWALAAVTIVAAVATIVSYSAVYSAIWFALSLLGTAGLLLFNGAQFLGVATVVVYAGAIVVTLLFVIMLSQPKGNASYDRISWGWFPKLSSVFVAAAIVGLLTMLLGGLKERATAAQVAVASPSDASATAGGLRPNSIENPVLDHQHHVARLGAVLFSQHLISVELAGTLLLAALVGAVAIATAGRQRLESQIEEAVR